MSHTVNEPSHVNRCTKRMTVMYHDRLRLHRAHAYCNSGFAQANSGVEFATRGRKAMMIENLHGG